jgi:hypothetical protein
VERVVEFPKMRAVWMDDPDLETVPESAVSERGAERDPSTIG